MWNQPDQNVDEGVKAQATGSTKISKLIDLKGGGMLVEWMKTANRTKNYMELETRIREELKPFLYNGGQGKMVSIKDIVKVRLGQPIEEDAPKSDDEKVDSSTGCGRFASWWCCLKSAVSSTKKPEKDSNSTDLTLKDMEALPGGQPKQEKLVCWLMDHRGGVGETPLHICLLNSTSIHADLSKWMLKVYPKLIYDIYLSDEFYGENVLHMAIVNEDPAMVKFLLDHKPDLHQRACGNFFTPDDQKGFRKSSFDQEWFDVPVKTNYEGYTYWGGYALGFAACLGQEECVRLLVAKGSDPNILDENGNTVLHLLVIHYNKMVDRMETGKNYCAPEDMFDLLVDLGAKINIVNRQLLTPLTLAAKLAKKEMYEHILELDREMYWVFGNVSCAGYPIEFIDTISENGEINTNSAMYQIVFGDESGHLDMIDGIIDKLLEEKWKTFAKSRFFRRFMIFVVYFIIFVAAFYLRPGTDTKPVLQNQTRISNNGTNYTVLVKVKNPCYLLRSSSPEDQARLSLEVLTLLGATVYVFLSLKEIYHQGYRIFFQTLSASPAKALFLMANCFVISMVPGRAACTYIYEDVMGVLAILCTAPYFLFFCRGFKIVGPFVVMIYNMIQTDLLRFFIIYLIFVVGFSQALYVLFRTMSGSSHFAEPDGAFMTMFVMSLGEFGDAYESFELFSKQGLDALPKVIFVVYMVLVTLLLVNMLIAMMGNTYQVICETQKEWLRQWAKIILVVEQTVTTEQRRKQQRNYSRPLDDGRRALVIRWHHTEQEHEDLKREREEEKKREQGMMRKRQEQRVLQKQKQKQRESNDFIPVVGQELDDDRPIVTHRKVPQSPTRIK